MIDARRFACGTMICGALALAGTANTNVELSFQVHPPKLPAFGWSDWGGIVAGYQSANLQRTNVAALVLPHSATENPGGSSDTFFLSFAAELENLQTSFSADEQQAIWEDFASLLA